VKFKVPVEAGIAQPAYNEDGSKKYTIVKNDKGKDVKQFEYDFRETVNYTIDFGNCTLGSHLIPLAVDSVKIKIAKARKNGRNAVLALNGKTFDVATLLTEKTVGPGAAYKTMDRMVDAGDVDGLNTLIEAATKRLESMNKKS